MKPSGLRTQDSTFRTQDLYKVAVPDNSCAYAGFIHRLTPFNFDSLFCVEIEDAFGSLFS